MKIIISKIKNKKLKGNVSLLIILILLASSVIALLSINQIQHLLTYGNTTFNYFRSFYLAKAGTEIGLTEVYNRGNGFENSIDSGSKIVTENLIGEYTGFNPYFEMEIKSNYKYLTNDVRYTNNCDSNNQITLGVGSGIVLSLFTDEIKGTKKILSDDEKDESYSYIKDLKIETQEHNPNFTFGLFVFDKKDGGMEDVVVKTGSSLQNFLLYDDDVSELFSEYTSKIYKYLTIKNSGTNEVKFCIVGHTNKEIPYGNSLISVRANYGDVEVGLESLVKKEIPDRSLNVLDRVQQQN